LAFDQLLTGDELGEPFLRLTGEAHERFVDWRTEL